VDSITAYPHKEQREEQQQSCHRDKIFDSTLAHGSSCLTASGMFLKVAASKSGLKSLQQ
jgi:hypothetical protein